LLKEKKKSSHKLLIKRSSAFGKEAEDLACRYLKTNKYHILERNYTCRFGEIDIIAKNRQVICFVEVKARASISFGKPYEFVTISKQAKIKKTALFFITNRKLPPLDYRFDVISIFKNKEGLLEIELLEGAFQ